MKFNVTTTFSLETEVSPEGIRFSGYDNIDHENSYFDSSPVTVGGGEVTFTVEAADEDAAEDAANEVICDNTEVEDDNGLTWVVTDLSHEIESAEMDKDEAFAIVRRLLDRLTENGTLSAQEREAFDVILQDV